MKRVILTIGARFGALLLLIGISPAFLLLAWFIAVTGGGPVYLMDRVMTEDGCFANSLRFRTTGKGTDLFRYAGRFLRRWGLDEFPGFWSAVRGDIGLSEVVRMSLRQK